MRSLPVSKTPGLPGGLTLDRAADLGAKSSRPAVPTAATFPADADAYADAISKHCRG
jgi:hypothetical protein